MDSDWRQRWSYGGYLRLKGNAETINQALISISALFITGISKVRVLCARFSLIRSPLAQEVADGDEAIRRLNKTLNKVNEMSLEQIQQNGIRFEN